MKTIDIKSILIGTLLTATIFLGVAATSPTDKWDKEQQWEVCSEAGLRASDSADYSTLQKEGGLRVFRVVKGGWEPFGHEVWNHTNETPSGSNTYYRRRIK
jgi:hypothetical protein